MAPHMRSTPWSPSAKKPSDVSRASSADAASRSTYNAKPYTCVMHMSSSQHCTHRLR
jgi:hypothetical protein